MLSMQLPGASLVLVWLVVLADCAIKGTLVLAVVGLVCVSFSRLASALRHDLWLWSLAVMLVMPVASWLLPSWKVPLLPSIPLPYVMRAGDADDLAVGQSFAAADHANGADRNGTGTSPAEPTPKIVPVGEAVKVEPQDGKVKTGWLAFSAWHPVKWLVMTWIVGAVSVLSMRCIGLCLIWRLRRSATLMHDPVWNDLAASLVRQMGIGRQVRLLTCDLAVPPMTWGLWHPVILLGGNRHEWSVERREAVLLHELAHIKRLDNISQSLAQFTRAVYWFHPLVWIAVWRLRIQRERACDDLVLASGVKAPDYAAHLLQIASQMRGGRLLAHTAGAMARPPSLEGRLLAILDSGRAHGTLGRAGRAVTLATCLLVAVSLATLHPAAATVAPGALQAPGGLVLRRVWEGARVDLGSVAPDGRYLAYVDWDETGDLYLVELDSGKSSRLTHTRPIVEGGAYAMAPVFSPAADKMRLAYTWLAAKASRFELRIMNILEPDAPAEPSILYHEKDMLPEAHAWSKDGTKILVTLQALESGRLARPVPSVRIALISVADGTVEVVFRKDVLSKHVRPMRLSPDMRYVAYSRPAGEDLLRDVFLVQTDGGEEIPLVTHPADDFVLGFTPDGKQLVFASGRTGNMSVWTLNLPNGVPRRTPQPAMRNIGPMHPFGFARDGSYYYGVYSGGRNVYTARFDPETRKILGEPTRTIRKYEGYNNAPEWCGTDGRYLACFSTPEGWPPVLVVHDFRTGQQRDLPLKPPIEALNNPSLRSSPDGRSLLCTGPWDRNRNGLYRIDMDVERGIAKTSRLPRPNWGANVLYPDWAHDGKSFFFGHFVAESGLTRRIAHRDLNGDQARELYRDALVASLTLSPDGRLLAFASGGKGQARYQLIPTAGDGTPRALADVEDIYQAIQPTIAWMPNGQHLLYTRKHPHSKQTELWSIAREGGKPEKTGLIMPTITNVRVHPSGRSIAFVSAERARGEIWAMENFLPAMQNTK